MNLNDATRSLIVPLTLLLALSTAIPAGAEAKPTASKRAEKKSVKSKKRDGRASKATPKKEEKSDASSYNLAQLTPIKWPFSTATEVAVAQGAWRTAWKEISQAEINTMDPPIAFLAGYVAMKVKEPAFALNAFKRADSDPAFKNLAALWAARAAFAQGAYLNAAGWAARVASDSIYHNDADILLTRALIAEERYSDALRTADRILAIRSLEAKLLYADIQVLAANHIAQISPELAKKKATSKEAKEFRRDHLLRAAPIYQEVAQRYPTKSESSYAAAQLRDLLKSSDFSADEKKKFSPDNYTHDATLARFDRLGDAYKSARIVKELPSAIANWDKGGDRCHAKYLIAKSYTRLRKHIDSLPWYQQVIDECQGEDRRNALYMGGKAAWNSNQKEKAIALFDQLLEEFPKHSFADDVLYFKARIHREEDSEGKARQALDKLVDRYPDGDMAKDAHWLIVRDAFKGDRLTNLVKYINNLKSYGEDDIYSKGRLDYFKGVALLRLKREKEARETFMKVVKGEPMSYYALMALNRLAFMGARGKWRPKPGENLCDPRVIKKIGNPGFRKVCAGLPTLTAKEVQVTMSIANEPLFIQGLRLVELNLESQAKAPFRALRKHLKGGSEDLWTLSYLLDLAGAYPFSHDIIRREIPDGWVNGYPRVKDSNGLKRWGLAYPRPFKELVEKWARVRGVQPAIIWAIMREESGFNPTIESWANAVGLMQLLPKTAQHVAKNDGIKVTKEELFEPEVAIRLGSGYVGELGNNGGGNPIYMIAGYNGGWANVARWLKEHDESIDMFVEDIPYGQTRNYTKRVLTSYWCYLMGNGGVYIPYL